MILFAKAPRVGQVKTRLIPALGADGAAKLHEAMVEHAWSRLRSAGADCELHTDVPTGAWIHIHPRRLQAAGDLGSRLLAALENGLERGCPVIITGSDAPGLPAGHLKRLMDGEADVTLGPTADGGYWAIACRRSHPRMFEGVRWSTRFALADTVQACQACGLSVAQGEAWFDIDEPVDLARLADYPDLARFAAPGKK